MKSRALARASAGFRTRNGVAALLVVTIVALFLLSIGIMLGVESNTSIFGGQATSQSDKAQLLAEAGVYDATIKIARNSGYSGNYTISESDGTVNVSVTAGSPVIVNVTSTVTVGNNIVQRAIQATITLDADGVITGVTKVNQ